MGSQLQFYPHSFGNKPTVRIKRSKTEVKFKNKEVKVQAMIKLVSADKSRQNIGNDSKSRHI